MQSYGPTWELDFFFLNQCVLELHASCLLPYYISVVVLCHIDLNRGSELYCQICIPVTYGSVGIIYLMSRCCSRELRGSNVIPSCCFRYIVKGKITKTLTGCGFFLACEDLGRMFDNSFLACAFFFFFLISGD